MLAIEEPLPTRRLKIQSPAASHVVVFKQTAQLFANFGVEASGLYDLFGAWLFAI